MWYKHKAVVLYGQSINITEFWKEILQEAYIHFSYFPIIWDSDFIVCYTHTWRV